MIPTAIEAHLQSHYTHFEHHTHAAAATAQQLAQNEHVSGYRVAKPVVVEIGGALAIAVVAATDHVNLPVLEEATGSRAEIVPEADFADRFRPCEPGAEPPLALFGVPIFADTRLLREWALVMAAGTHEDAVVLDTSDWAWCEKVQPMVNLGRRSAPRA
jgi:Ala-tRNA(Pro) deacylase